MVEFSVLMPCRAAWIMALASAWAPLQSSCLSPEGMLFFSLRQPTSSQWGSPIGAPL